MTLVQPQAGSPAANRWNTAVQSTKPGQQQASPAQYDPDKCYVKASDQRGHSEKVGFKIPPDVYAQVMRFVADDAFPDYQTMGDVFRDAVVHLMARRRDQVTSPEFRDRTDQIIRDLGFWQAMDNITTNIERRQEYRDRLRTSLLTCERERSWAEMEHILDEVEFRAVGAEEPHATELTSIVNEWRKRWEIGTTKKTPDTVVPRQSVML